ncbi:acyl-CoA dehydrogenase [Comamonas sp. 26]|uniref:acyl-CoA dehydrogenase n=1 Tax=Comamonas sp. 26 TaxID=2035201 RepID=UPI000C1A165F|nr:acyl-CoA dehydrogenase [Comamonas sp. 26]PIG09894.1 alkylation response protein AidB-like acyl-CoA dehydrogenase [Comamonas sp. 26]
MNFDFSDDQNALRTEIRKFLTKESPLTQARALLEGEGRYAQGVWNGMAQLGVTSLMLPEDCGGIGLGAMEMCVVAEEVGRQLSPVPLASTMYLAVQALMLSTQEQSPQRQKWLQPVSGGSIGCLAAPTDGQKPLADLPVFDGKTLKGECLLVADGMAAQWGVALARNAAGADVLVAFQFDTSVQRKALKTLDPSKPYASLSFGGTAAELLDGAASAAQVLTRVRNRAAVMLAFEQLGAADAALEMAAAYAKERKAFGRAIGSYQGIKHKLANLYTNNQLARAHCYYGAWALTSDMAQAAGAPDLAAAAAAARVSTTQALSDAAQESLHTHGGMGYTWELDCHLFYRRARQQAVELGNIHAWREQVAAELQKRMDEPAQEKVAQSMAEGDSQSMDFEDTPEEAAFRAECRAWLQLNAEPKASADDYFGRDMTAEQRMEAARIWQGKKAAGGFGAITWPKVLGGRGGTPMQELIWRQEEGKVKVPTGMFNVSLGMVLPSVMAHASPEVLGRHVAPALGGKNLWCQLLSEPGAGSDLGMVRTRAERATDGREGWLINGQKVWTSLAQFAQFGLVLTRTNPLASKFEGMSTFFLNMKSPGITVRPIRQAGGESEFNEVFFENVFVPDSQLVGKLGGGWKVTLTGLMAERLAIGGVIPAELWRTTAGLLADYEFQGKPALQDGRMRERWADLYLKEQALWLLQCRALTALSKGRQPGPEMSGAKNVAAAALQAFSYFAIDLLGERGVLAASELGERFAMVERLWFGSAGMRIAGGTDEVVLNSIGERVLGLAPETRTDKDMPFSELVA